MNKSKYLKCVWREPFVSGQYCKRRKKRYQENSLTLIFSIVLQDVCS